MLFWGILRAVITRGIFIPAGLVERFRYLRPGLSVLLAPVGVEMIVGEFVAIPIWVTLLTVLAVLAGSIALSLLHAPVEQVADEIEIPGPFGLLTRPGRGEAEQRAGPAEQGARRDGDGGREGEERAGTGIPSRRVFASRRACVAVPGVPSGPDG